MLSTNIEQNFTVYTVFYRKLFLSTWDTFLYFTFPPIFATYFICIFPDHEFYLFLFKYYMEQGEKSWLAKYVGAKFHYPYFADKETETRRV